MNKFMAYTLFLLLGGCAITKPVAVVSKDGVMRGTATSSLSGGTFRVSNTTKVCSGSYDSLDSSPTITMIVQCDDGKKGFAIVTRDRSGLSGHGRVRMNDGTEADLIFGDAAASF